jgi:DNA-binding HxlR family transcriptional regulator
VLGRTYDDQICSLARTLEVVGERWTLLIVRDALHGIARFEDFQASLDIARNTLTDRLGLLVDYGVFDRVLYQERPERHEYRLTRRGRDLVTAIVALIEWGDTHRPDPDGPPRRIEHAGCGGRVVARLYCTRCKELTRPDQIVSRPGRGHRTGAARQAATRQAATRQVTPREVSPRRVAAR